MCKAQFEEIVKDKSIIKKEKKNHEINIRIHFHQIRHFPESQTSACPCRESSSNDKRVEAATRFFRPTRFRKAPVQEFHRSIDPISIDKHSPPCQWRTFRGMLERSREISGSLLCPPSSPTSSPNAHPSLSSSSSSSPPPPLSLSMPMYPRCYTVYTVAGGGDTGIVSIRRYIHCNRANPRAPRVYGHNRLFRVDLCGALRQNVRRDPA